MLKIVTIPNSVLTSGTKKVELFDKNLNKLINEMEQTLNAQIDPQGVGLAAPQVNINKAIFIVKPTVNSEIEAFINPKIIETVTTNSNSNKINPKSKKRKKQKLEGCLSIPRIWGPVERAKKVLLEYQDLEGKSYKKWFTDFKAIIIQHEVDHLNGILFTQRALEQNNQLLEEKDGELKKVAGI